MVAEPLKMYLTNPVAPLTETRLGSLEYHQGLQLTGAPLIRQVTPVWSVALTAPLAPDGVSSIVLTCGGGGGTALTVSETDWAT